MIIKWVATYIMRFKMKCKIRSKWQQLNDVVYFLGTKEKKWYCEFLPYDSSSRNKKNKAIY